MADITPNLQIRKRQLGIRIAELELNKDRMYLRKLEIEEENKKIDLNIEATDKALVELRKEI